MLNKELQEAKEILTMTYLTTELASKGIIPEGINDQVYVGNDGQGFTYQFQINAVYHKPSGKIKIFFTVDEDENNYGTEVYYADPYDAVQLIESLFDTHSAEAEKR